jgi:DNA-binding NtrC family response regulator
MPDQTHILCVDDEPRVLEGLVLNLRRYYRVSTAINGQKGLAIIDGDDPPAVVVSDMRMPEMETIDLVSLREGRADRIAERARLFMELVRDARGDAPTPPPVFVRTH